MIEIEYDGTNFCGWQTQPKGRTVQGEIGKVLHRLAHKEIVIHGAGRTDSKVHARGQTASFKIDSTIPINRLPLAMNSLLPEDVSIKKAYEVPLDFHARYSATGKRYSYQIHRGRSRSALLTNYSYHVFYSLDLGRMKEGSNLLLGTHDFKGFMTSGSSVKNTVRTLHSIEIEEMKDSLWITFEGNGFLYNMVRIMVGTLVEISAGKRGLDSIISALQHKDRSFAGPTAPPQGLFLEKVYYPLTH